MRDIVKLKKVIWMKILTLGLVLLLLTSCGVKGTNDIDPVGSAPPAQEDPDREREISARILNFRTQDKDALGSEARLIQSHEEYKAYLSDYAIVENPAFIGNPELDILKGINEAFFKDKAIAVAVSVESSGSNVFEGKRAWVKGSMLLLEVERRQPGIGTTDIATRHAVFILNGSELAQVEQVELRGQIGK